MCLQENGGMERNRGDDAMNLSTVGVKKEKENAAPNIPNGEAENLAQQVRFMW